MVLDPPDVKATFLQRNTTTLELSFINPNTGWDFFSVDVAPVIPQAIVNKTISSLPLEIAGLESGAQYNFKVSVAITKFCDYGINHPSSFFVTTCTSKPFIYVSRKFRVLSKLSVLLLLISTQHI